MALDYACVGKYCVRMCFGYAWNKGEWVFEATFRAKNQEVINGR
jgi:hypothetical protein